MNRRTLEFETQENANQFISWYYNQGQDYFCTELELLDMNTEDLGTILDD